MGKAFVIALVIVVGLTLVLGSTVTVRAVQPNRVVPR